MTIDYPRTGRRGVRRWLPSYKQLLAVCVLGIAIVFGLAAFAYAQVNVPQPNDFSVSQATIVTYRDGTEMGRLSAQNRQSVPLSKVPQSVQKAVLAGENRDFYSDSGVSPKGILRAFWTNLRGGGKSQGGSTITQQYVRNAFLSQEKTYTRKIKEAIIAIKIDRQKSKSQILEDYLNTIYFGRGAYGVQTAAQAYFGKDVSQLNASEGAVLASLLRSPGAYDPQTHRSALQGRWRFILDAEAQEGWLTAQQAQRARFPKIAPRSTENQLKGPNGYLLTYVQRELEKLGYTEQQIPVAGLRVRTTFVPKAQKAAVKAARKQLKAMREPAPKKFKGLHLGLTAVEPGTGEIVAMYGGRDYIKRQFNDAIQAKIQPGSAFKPFSLAAALDDGVSLQSIFDGNSPYFIPGLSKPVNNEFDQSYGPVTLLKATEDSINTAYTDLAVKIGPQKILDAAVAAGIPKNSPGLKANTSITLGTSSQNTLEMADGYATFASHGVRAAPFSVLEVKTANGKTDYKAKPKTDKTIGKPVTDDVSFALQDVVKFGTGTEAQNLERPAAGKTGTAEDKTAWFVGYTPQLSAAVVIFKGDGNKSLDGVAGLSTFFGGSYPTKTWTAFMKGALKGKPVVDFPPAANLGERVKRTSTNSPPPSTSTSSPPSTTSSSPPSTSTSTPPPSTTTTTTTSTPPPTTTKTPTPTPTQTTPTQTTPPQTTPPSTPPPKATTPANSPGNGEASPPAPG